MEEKKIPYVEEEYDVVVVGAGHAGCEAALACARLGLETIIFTVSVDSIAMMPCNPNIGGSSKGHLVREIRPIYSAMGSCTLRFMCSALPFCSCTMYVPESSRPWGTPRRPSIS